MEEIHLRKKVPHQRKMLKEQLKVVIDKKVQGANQKKEKNQQQKKVHKKLKVNKK